MRDVNQLEKFYQEPIGIKSSYYMLESIKKMWPSIKSDELILSIGYFDHFLDYFLQNNSSIICGMPSRMGVMKCNDEKEKNRSFLMEDWLMPLQSSSIDKIILIHSFETSRNPDELLRELWRVLKPNGKMILILPNRMSMWSRIETTPFSEGNPYSISQIQRTLNEHFLFITNDRTCLFFPPFPSKTLFKTYDSIEKVGEKFLKNSGGVILIECEKQLLRYTHITSEKLLLRNVTT